MSLYVAELDTTSTASDADGVNQVLTAIEAAAAKQGGEFIESQVTADHGRVFAVIEHDNINKIDLKTVHNEIVAVGLAEKAIAKNGGKAAFGLPAKLTRTEVIKP